MVGRNLHSFLERNQEHVILAPKSKDLNLLEFNSTNYFIKETKPELVIHCAGRVGGIQANISNPTEFLFENLEMGKNLVMSSKENNVSRLLNLGSSCMYPRDREQLHEKDILSGYLEPTNEGYAIAKITVAKLCEYISTQYNFSYKTIVPCNLYGPWDKFDPTNSHMIPSIIRKIHEAKKNSTSVEIWGDGSARREFMHVSDLVSFIDIAISKFELVPSLINVGLGYDFSVLEYYQAACKVIDYNSPFIFNKDKPVGMKRKLLNTEQASHLGWKPRLTLNEGILNTYQFFQKEYL